MQFKHKAYKFTEEDLFIVLDFVKKYHLEPTKAQRGRTNQGKRGFGQELDEWVPGKLLEIAVCRILETYTDSKKLSPDFKIYTDKEVGDRSDPDITTINEKDPPIERKPNIFVEIKRYDMDARWMGPRQHQLKDMEEGYMVHASIGLENKLRDKHTDITAIILKKIIKNESFDLNEFSNFEDLVGQIEYVYSFKTLRDQGHFFASGNIIPETNFPEARDAYKKNGDLSKVYTLINSFNGTKKLNMKWDNNQDLLSFSEWTVSGEFQILKNKINKEYIYAKTKTNIFSKVFGSFDLEKGKTYRFHFTNTLGKQGGKDVFKSIDDYWFSKRRLDELLDNKEIDDKITCLKEISLKI